MNFQPDLLSLFPPLNHALIDVLEQLTPEQWQLQTVAREWKVKDVASHLLDTGLRRIALYRDQWSPQPERPINSYKDLLDYLNELNGEWVSATRRLSPRILIDWLKTSQDEVYHLYQQLDLDMPAIYAVSWAGEEASTNRFDIAREYTERWLHQQQIRYAIDDECLLSPQFYHPLLTTYVNAWPVACNRLKRPDGTRLKLLVTGAGGGTWYLVRVNDKWFLSDEPGEVAAETIIDGKLAWILFSKSVRANDIEGAYEIIGDQEAGAGVLNMISVMA